MVRYIVITSLVVLVGASACPAGQNSAGKLAMHLVASDQILGCEDLLPASCEDIDGDLSAAELGIVSGDCLEPDPVSGLCLLGYLSFHYTGEDPLYIEYGQSTFSHPLYPANFFLDCTPDYEEDYVFYETGCVIKGETLDLPLCGGREDMGGGGGGLVWAMCLEQVDGKSPGSGQGSDDLGRARFVLPSAKVHVNLIGDSKSAKTGSRAFPLPYLRLVAQGETTWRQSLPGGMRLPDYEYYVGFLPVQSDGSLPAEGIDWWSWEHGKSIAPEKWVTSSFRWEDPAEGLDLSFSEGALSFGVSEGARVSTTVPFDRGYVGAFDRVSRRVGIVGCDEAGAWHLVVLDDEGRIVFEDPWETPPSTHLHSSPDGSALLYAVWEDATTATSRPHVHPLPPDESSRPAYPEFHPTLGAYWVSLRTGKLEKVPQLKHRQWPADSGFNARWSFSRDGRYAVHRAGGRTLRYFDTRRPQSPVQLWEAAENRTIQSIALSADGRYIAETLRGPYYPDGPEGPIRWESDTTVLRLRDRAGAVIGSKTMSGTRAACSYAVVFEDPHLFVGYDGSGLQVRCIYLHDLRVPWGNAGDEGETQ